MTGGAGRDDYYRFEREGWDAAASSYDRYFGELANGAALPLMQAITGAPQERFLDLACGPGCLAATAIHSLREVDGVDFSPAMIREAQRRLPTARWHVAEAESLPFPDQTFASIGMNLSLHHCWDAASVCREAHRVLKVGGRFGVTVWGSPQGPALGLGLLMRALSAHGTLDVGLPPAPPIFRLSNPDTLLQTLQTCGFEETSVREIELGWNVASVEAFLDSFLNAGVRVGHLLRAQTAGVLQAVADELRSTFLPFQRSDQAEKGYRLPMGILLSCGTRE